MGPATRVEDSVADILRGEFADAHDDILVSSLDRTGIRAVVTVLFEVSTPPSVRLLAREEPLASLFEDFLIASRAADLVASESLALRTIDDDPRCSLILTETGVSVIVGAGETVASLSSTNDEFHATATDRYEEIWARGEPYELRTPPLSRIRETLRSEFGSDTATDFDALIDTLETAVGDGDGLDAVTICLLVAARNRELLYDISKWGEDVGIASKATFSRTKTRLEDQGLLETEKVPIDVGRPRLRLILGDDRLGTASPGEMAAIAHRLLES